MFARTAGGCLILGLALTCPGSAEASPVAVRILEVGRAGQLRIGFPAPVRVEIATRERLEGTLEVRLAKVRTGRLPDVPETRVLSHIARAHFALEAGERRLVTAYLPTGGPRSDAEVRWRVVDSNLEVLAEGREPVREAVFGYWRSLSITDAAVPEPRRSPRDAFDEALPYAEFTGAFVSGQDLAGLTPSQRRALLDWTASGGVLVVTSPPGPALPGEPALEGALVWRSEAGHEAREKPEHLGFVRRVDLPLADLVRPERPAVTRLLLSTGTVQPGIPEIPFLRQELERRYGWLLLHGERGPHEPRRVVSLASAVGVLLLLLVLGGIGWTSRPAASIPAPVLLVGALVAIASPGLVYLALSRLRTGNVDRCWDLVYQDGVSPLQSRWTRAALGGGGGSAAPALEFSTGPRVIWSIWTGLSWEYGLQADQEPTGLLRVVVDANGLTPDRDLTATRTEVGSADPAWDEEGLRMDEALPSGELRPRRAFQRVAIIGPPGVARFGSVRPGDKLDLAGAVWDRRPLRSRQGVAHFEAVLGSVCTPSFVPSFEGCRLSAFFAVGLEAAASPTLRAVSGSDAFSVQSVHVQRLRLAPGNARERELAAGLPAERTGNLLSVQVPEVLWAAMREYDIRLGYGSSGVYPEADAHAPAEVSAPSGGFRTVTFRVTGPPGPVASRYGPGMVECLWRRR